MASANELVTLLNKFSLTDRLKIVEEILRGIREGEVSLPIDSDSKPNKKPKILDLAGIISEEEASEYGKAIQESRRTDRSGQ